MSTDDARTVNPELVVPAGELAEPGRLTVETARDMLLHPGGYGRPLLAVASEVVVTALDVRGRERDAARAEVGRLREEAADALARQTMLKGMSVEDGAALLELDSPREIVIAWVYAAREMLGDAPNYSETRVDFPTASASMEVKAAGEVDRYVLTVQRAGKLTPHEARMAAERERDELRARDEAAKAVVREMAVIERSRVAQRLRAIYPKLYGLLCSLDRAHEGNHGGTGSGC